MAKKPLTDRSLRAIKTRKKLFHSAEKLIDKHGFDNVTIEEICKKAGVSVGAFYHYFNSKTDIIIELFKEIDDYFEEKTGQDSGEDPVRAIETFFSYYAKFHVDQGVEHTSRILKVDGDLFLNKTRYMYKRLNELVDAAKAAGSFRGDADPALVIDYLLVIARGLLFDWSLAHGEYDLEEKMASYIALALKVFL